MMHEEVCMHAFVKSLLCVLLAPAEKSWAPEIVYTAVFNCEPVIGKGFLLCLQSLVFGLISCFAI